jgi:hypothetical protein
MTCSTGSPATRWSIMKARSSLVPAAERSSRASSSAKTEPEARNLRAMSESVVRVFDMSASIN